MRKSVTNVKQKEASLDNKMIYKGKVSVTFTKGGKVIYKNKGKNAGTTSLFNFFAQCMAGNYNDRLRPKFIKLMSFEDGESENITESYIPFSGLSVDSTKTKFKFLIPFSSLKEGKVVAELQLYNDNRNMLASYMIPKSEQYTLGSGESIVVDWELEISNGAEEE